MSRSSAGGELDEPVTIRVVRELRSLTPSAICDDEQD